MKSIIVTFVVSTVLFFSCNNSEKVNVKNESRVEKSQQKDTFANNNSASAILVKKDTTPTKKPHGEFLPPNEDESKDFWTVNNCTRQTPKPTVPESKRPDYYSFQINNREGYGKEVLRLENGYKLDITNKGCNSVSLVFSYFFYAKDLDIKDQNAVSAKVIELLKMTAKVSEPAYNFKKRIPALEQAVEQIGPFAVGEELVLNSNEIGESFMLERLEEKNGKIFMSYYFAFGPL